MADLVVDWYGNAKRKKLKSPTSSQERAMATASPLDDARKQRLLELAAVDKTLDKTRQLLLLATQLQTTAVAHAVQEFAGQVLQNHPVFASPSLRAIFGRGASTSADANRALEKRDVVRIIETAMNSNPRPLFSTESKGKKKKKTGALEQCRHNAVRCSLIWLYLEQRLTLDLLVDCLREHFWNVTAARHETGADRLGALMGAGDTTAAFVASAVLVDRLRHEVAGASAARAAESRASQREREARAKLATMDADLAEVRTRNEILQEELERQRRLRAEDVAELKDGYQQLRGRVLRRLRQEVSLLEDGLRALKRDPPKVKVMLDHGERATDSLRLEIKRLREGAKE